ncbi:hypothetical protein SAY86_023432 [Trapa natans]|uniref:Uncharacterized protein n=1 Tax=Trapa natans TaxID=22666 RepID=A0AAN7M727_TRANT|nr:hypothetical protein SAY86_023432 [Trapa natans]
MGSSFLMYGYLPCTLRLRLTDSLCSREDVSTISIKRREEEIVCMGLHVLCFSDKCTKSLLVHDFHITVREDRVLLCADKLIKFFFVHDFHRIILREDPILIL